MIRSTQALRILNVPKKWRRKGTNMKKNLLRSFTFLFVFAALIAAMLVGCGQSNGIENENTEVSMSITNSVTSNIETSSVETSQDIPAENNTEAAELYVSFGDDGAPFTMHLYENDTAAAIARHVGTADWRLPIYNYDNYDNWEVMQYYDIPSRYEIPSSPEYVTAEQAGTVYYSEPNRIVLFYGDAEISGEYTPVGYFDYSEEFASAVENNPVLQGWGNKIVLISAQK